MPTYRCPVVDEDGDQCDETAPTAGAIQGHISGTGYGPHQGESGYAYEPEDLLVEDSDDDSPDETDAVDGDSGSDSGPEQDSADATAPDTAPAETATDDSDATPDGGGGIVPEGESVSTVSHGSEEPQCPGCGEQDSVQAAPAYANAASDQLDSDHVDLLESSDYVCGECGGVWDA